MLRITDKRNNCTGFDTVYVSQNLIKPTTDLGRDSTLNCITDTFNVLAKINDTKPSYDFKWSGPGVTSATQRNNPLKIWIPGTYTTIINTPNLECLSYDTLIVNIDTLRTPLDLPDILWFDCNSSSINYMVNDFSKIDSIEWFDIFNKKIITSDAGRTVTYSQVGINFYTVLYKNGCKLTKSFLTRKYTKITIEKPIITPSCTDVGNGTVKIKILTGNGPFTISLGGSRKDTITFFKDLPPGSGTITVFDRNGCQEDFVFNIPALLSLPDHLGDVPIKIQICKDTTLYADSILLYSTQFKYPKDSVVYKWAKDGKDLSPFVNSLKIEGRGKYGLSISNKNGCGEVTIVYEVEFGESVETVEHFIQLCKDTTLYADSIVLAETKFRFPKDTLILNWSKDGRDLGTFVILYSF